MPDEKTHDAENLPIERYDDQLAEKVARLKMLMSPFAAPEPEVFRSPVDHYRMRAEFRIWHDADDMYHIMFDQQTSSVFASTSSRRPAS